MKSLKVPSHVTSVWDTLVGRLRFSPAPALNHFFPWEAAASLRSVSKGGPRRPEFIQEAPGCLGRLLRKAKADHFRRCPTPTLQTTTAPGTQKSPVLERGWYWDSECGMKAGPWQCQETYFPLGTWHAASWVGASCPWAGRGLDTPMYEPACAA